MDLGALGSAWKFLPGCRNRGLGYAMSPQFVHLHLHSEFSLNDGLIRLKPLVERAAELGMAAVAVTDFANLFGVVKFYRAALAKGIKPIVGMEVDIAEDCDDISRGRVVLLAQNRAGYRSLCRLSSRGYRAGWGRGSVRVRHRWIAEYSEGVIVLSGGHNGPVGGFIRTGRIDQARAELNWWREAFPGRFYLELTRTGRHGEDSYLHVALDLAASTETPVVATNDTRFLAREEYESHEARVCIQEGYVLADPKRPRNYSQQQYLRSPDEMDALFADLPEALANSVEIAKRCNFQLTLGEYRLPEFEIPRGGTLEAYFRDSARQGLERRLDKLFDRSAADWDQRRAPYDERLNTELQVILQMGFPGYFLIVADFIDWARQNGIPVGPGRGSGAGSLVAYSLGITDLDPLQYDLLFERFLNPERISMPDFDVDFCMEGRDRVIEYVANRYGRNRVGQIATHGTMAAKAVVRDVGRIMSHPYGFVDRIAKLIPFELGVTLDKALLDSEELKNLYDQDEEVRAILDMGRALEGLARNVGKHAGGVVIAPTDLTDFTPIYCEEGSQSLVSQLDKDDVEAVGLVKFDFLGLRTLTIIDWAVDTVNRVSASAGRAPIAIADIPLDEPAAYSLLKRQQTTAVFQLESSGMKDLIRRLQPDCFEEIIALVALYRPGPLQSGMVDDFVDRKHGRAAVAYPHPDLEPILRSTYGVILYQEQVMQIAQVLAGYSLGEADLLRRAMGKKKAEEMAKQRAIFTDGCTSRGVEEAIATHIFDLMEKFAGYGFNKSHSAAYALVSYQTAWLKAHHPAAFMAAVLSSDMDNTDKVFVFIDECRDLGLKVQPPSVNDSELRFTVGSRGQIVYGLGAVKGVGKSAVDAILEERRGKAPFSDLFEFCRRIDLQRANRRVLESLICAGALDCLNVGRATLMASLPEALKTAEQHSKNRETGQTDLFGLSAANDSEGGRERLASVSVPEWDEQQRLAQEKQTLGGYLTGHPVERHLEEFAQFTSGRLAEVVELGNRELRGGGGGRRRREKPVVVAGLVVESRVRFSQRGGRMAFVTLDDRSARAEVRLFGEVFERHRERVIVDTIVVVEGALVFDEFSDSVRLNVARLMDLDQAREAFARKVVITIDGTRFGNGLVGELEGVLSDYASGFCPVLIDYHGTGARARLSLDAAWHVRPAGELMDRLGGLLGPGKVRLHFG